MKLTAPYFASEWRASRSTVTVVGAINNHSNLSFSLPQLFK